MDIIGFIMIAEEFRVDEIETKTGVDSRTLFQKKLFQTARNILTNMTH